MKSDKRLSLREAYAAMYVYLEHLYGRSSSSDLAGFLGSMALLDDGQPADPAVWPDWTRAVDEVLSGKADLRLKLTKPDG